MFWRKKRIPWTILLIRYVCSSVVQIPWGWKFDNCGSKQSSHCSPFFRQVFDLFRINDLEWPCQPPTSASVALQTHVFQQFVTKLGPPESPITDTSQLPVIGRNENLVGLESWISHSREEYEIGAVALISPKKHIWVTFPQPRGVHFRSYQSLLNRSREVEELVVQKVRRNPVCDDLPSVSVICRELWWINVWVGKVRHTNTTERVGYDVLMHSQSPHW
jgi:hypothetical protein